MSDSEPDSEVDDQVEEEELPMPARGVGVICGLDLKGAGSVPVMYFGEETRSCGAVIPASPERVASRSQTGDSANRIGSSNPLNSIIRKWEAKFARHGGFMEASEFVSSSGRNDGRYYEADEWLDDGNEEGGQGEEDHADFDPSMFRAIDTPVEDVGGDESDEEANDEEEEASNDTNDESEEVGGNCETLLKRLDGFKQPVVKDLITELEQVQMFPGHSKQKKQKSLRDCTAKLRRLLPKVGHVQSKWQAAVWELVNVANPNSFTMQFFLDLWNDLSTSKQREDLVKEQADVVSKLTSGDCLAQTKEMINAWKRGESITRAKFENIFNLVSKLWDVWVLEEECAGRVVPLINPLSGAQHRIEKRFLAHIAELAPELGGSPLSYVLLRIALFGTRKTKNKPVLGSTVELSAAAAAPPVEDDADASNPAPTTTSVVSLPCPIFLYKRNELLKCKMIDIKGLAVQVVQVTDKDWDTPGDASGVTVQSPAEFQSLTALFESYQQKFVRRQDRVKLASLYDGWKNFAIKTNNNEYVYLYDIASKASLGNTFGFTDKYGNPIYLPALSAVRNADAEKQKKTQQAKDERKRKREAELALLKTEPPCSDAFYPFPCFDKTLFAMSAAIIPN